MIKNSKTLVFLTHFGTIILRHNSKYGWGNVKGVVTCDNY